MGGASATLRHHRPVQKYKYIVNIFCSTFSIQIALSCMTDSTTRTVLCGIKRNFIIKNLPKQYYRKKTNCVKLYVIGLRQVLLI